MDDTEKSKRPLIDEEKQLAKQAEQSNQSDKRSVRAAIISYTDAAKSFKQCELEVLRAASKKEQRLIWLFGGIALVAVLSNMLLMPLKTVEPFLVRVDNNSGFTDIVRPVSAVQDPERVDDEFWLASYVRMRESYNWFSQKGAYEYVQIHSHQAPFAEYRNFQLSSLGYTALLKDTAQIETKINGVTFLSRENGRGTAHVRFTKTILDRDGNPDRQRPASVWLAIVTYDYKNAPKNRGAQWINPRGFGVTSYRTSQEVVTNGQ